MQYASPAVRTCWLQSHLTSASGGDTEITAVKACILLSDIHCIFRKSHKTSRSADNLSCVPNLAIRYQQPGGHDRSSVSQQHRWLKPSAACRQLCRVPPCAAVLYAWSGLGEAVLPACLAGPSQLQQLLLHMKGAAPPSPSFQISNEPCSTKSRSCCCSGSAKVTPTKASGLVKQTGFAALGQLLRISSNSSVWYQVRTLSPMLLPGRLARPADYTHETTAKGGIVRIP